jgi:hypothetical protein
LNQLGANLKTVAEKAGHSGDLVNRVYLLVGDEERSKFAVHNDFIAWQYLQRWSTVKSSVRHHVGLAALMGFRAVLVAVFDEMD